MGFPVLAGSEKLQWGMVNFYEPILLPVLGVSHVGDEGVRAGRQCARIGRVCKVGICRGLAINCKYWYGQEQLFCVVCLLNYR